MHVPETFEGLKEIPKSDIKDFLTYCVGLISTMEQYKGVTPMEVYEDLVKSAAEKEVIWTDENGFKKELESLLNKYSKENGSNTPDFMLAEFLNGCLEVFNMTVMTRSKWYGGVDSIDGSSSPVEDKVEGD